MYWLRLFLAGWMVGLSGGHALGATPPLPDPRFQPAGGAYPATFGVLVDDPDSSTVLRYTRNGDAPALASPRVTGVLSIPDRSGDSNTLSMIPGTATVNQHTDGWYPPKGLIPKATPLRAAAFGKGTNASRAITQTYFVGHNPMARYHLPVVSLTINTNDLFNYNTGIYVLGKIFDDYVKAHPTEPLTGHTPANYTQRGPAWERLGFLEWFEPTGERILQQPVMIDIQGQSSRSFRQKSLGLKAVDDGVSPGSFRQAFFAGLTNRAGDSITRFDHLRLANSGNDWAYTLLRDALCHTLVAATRIDTLAYRPVAVYLDGEFWGVHNLREQQDVDYLADHYGVAKSEAVICETIGTVVEGLPTDGDAFVNLRSFVDSHDLTVSTNYAYVATQMDVDNFIEYQVAEIYFANADWPHNNIRFWRRRLEAYDPSAPYGLDGRWRWLLFDTDLGYGHPWSGGYSENSLSYAMDPNGRPGLNAPWSTALLRGLVKHPDFRRRFINRYADALNSIFKESVASNAVERLQAAIAPAMEDHTFRWRTSGGTTNGWRDEVRVLRLFASQRPAYARQHIVSQFGLSGFATVTLDTEPRGSGEIRINDLRVNESTPGANPTNAYPWKGTYFRSVPVDLRAITRPGYRFLGWKDHPEWGTTQALTLTLNGTTNFTARFARTLAPHDLATAPFELRAWPSGAPAGWTPDHVLLEQTDVRDPVLATAMSSVWPLAYHLTSRSRALGLDEAGLAFLNTSDPQADPDAGYLGSLVVALTTTGVGSAEVSWVGGTVDPNDQAYALRLQYAVGEALYRDLPGPDGFPIEYARSPEAGDARVIGPVPLPADALGQPFVRLRWKYHRQAEGKGSRAELRLDDILVTRKAAPAAAQFDPDVDLRGAKVGLVFKASPRTGYRLLRSTDLRTWEDQGRYLTDLDGMARADVLPLEGSGRVFYRAVAE
jgi:hypothetical protein